MSLTNGLWLAGYVLLMAGLAAAMFAAQASVIATYDTPQARAEWEAWRAAAKKQSVDNQTGVEGPVQRKVPKSAEPPALVLMRDYFGVCLAGSLFFSSLLFGVTMIVVRGALSAPGTSEPPSKRGEGGED
jgi:hypothetical protein